MGGIENVHGLEDIQGFTDIHCHVLPMVDDGAETMEMALDMLRIAAEEGIRKMILTPHQKADRKCVTPEGIIRRMVLLQEEVDKKGIPVKLFPGNEIFTDMGWENCWSWEKSGHWRILIMYWWNSCPVRTLGIYGML